MYSQFPALLVTLVVNISHYWRLFLERSWFKNHSIWFVQLVLATQFIAHILNLNFLVLQYPGFPSTVSLQDNLSTILMISYRMWKKHPNVESKLTRFTSWSTLLYRLVKQIPAPSTDTNIFRTLLGHHFLFFVSIFILTFLGSFVFRRYIKPIACSFVHSFVLYSSSKISSFSFSWTFP